MYRFVDTQPTGGEERPLLSINTIFKGANLDDVLSDENGSFTTLTVAGRSNATYKRATFDIAGMEGQWEEDRGYQKPREITVRFRLRDRTNEGFRNRLERLNGILTGTKEPLIFTDENFLFYASLLELDIPDEDSNDLVGTLTFLCSDPFKYGPERERTTPYEDINIYYEGTARGKPIIDLTVREPVTYAAIQNNSDMKQIGAEYYPKYMMIGRPADIEETPYVKYQRRYYTDANSLVGWGSATNSDIDGGVVSGNMTSRYSRFVADSYGSGSSWHGPAIKTSLTDPIQSFRLRAFVNFNNTDDSKQVGRIEIYLKDVNGNTVCKMSLKDTATMLKNTVAVMRAGDMSSNYYLINEHGNQRGNWNDFSGQLRMSREWDPVKNENVWSAYVAKVDTSTGRHYAIRHVSTWRDGGRFNREVAQIVVHVGASADHMPIGETSGVSSIILEEITEKPEGVPIIAEAGDVFTFDSVTGDVFMNGEPRNDLLTDFGSDFLDLVYGDNLIATDPEAFDMRVRYRPRYR